MNKLIVITGISGSGKTTLARYLNQKIENSVWLSPDILQENVYDTIGFKNKKQKKDLKKIAHNTFQKILKESMKRGDECIIVEFPFREKWKKFFEECLEKYDYQAITINAILDDFNENWQRILKRDLSDERHPSHELENYNPLYKNEYKRAEAMLYEDLKKEYDTLEMNQINLGKVFEFNNQNKQSLQEILKKIKE